MGCRVGSCRVADDGTPITSWYLNHFHATNLDNLSNNLLNPTVPDITAPELLCIAITRRQSTRSIRNTGAAGVAVHHLEQEACKHMPSRSTDADAPLEAALFGT